MNWIADCSIAVAWCFDDEATSRTESLLDRTQQDALILPLHWPLEVTNVLQGAVKRGRLTESQACRSAEILMSLPIRFDLNTHLAAFPATYELARKHQLTTYDAAYLELAMRVTAPLATNDRQLARAAAQCGVLLW